MASCKWIVWLNVSSFESFFFCEIRKPRKFALCNTESWALESGILLEIGIQSSKFHWQKTVIQYLKSGVNSVKSGIQDEDGATLSSVVSCQWLDLATQFLYKKNHVVLTFCSHLHRFVLQPQTVSWMLLRYLRALSVPSFHFLIKVRICWPAVPAVTKPLTTFWH